jgi:hypothetical protein
MSTASIPPDVTAAVGSATHLELGAVVLVVVMVIATLLVRMKLDRDQRIRKAASQGYYDPDVAHYVHGPVPDAPSRPAADDTDQALAPSFTAPHRSKASKRGASRPPAPRPPALRPVTAAFGADDAVPPRPVPAFDQAVAVANRPATTRSPFATRVPSAPAAPLRPAPPPPPATTVPVDVPALSLPRMEQTLPPGVPGNGPSPVPDRGGAPGR